MVGTADTKVLLDKRDFRDEERTVVTAAAGTVSLFKYRSGVEAMRIDAGRCSLVILPFRGQQVWRYVVDGEDLTMRTTFAEPTASESFGESYGAFLLHCGVTGIGAPGEGDQHSHHGELPTISTDRVTVVAGEEDGRDFLGVDSTFEYRATHGFAYSVRTELRVFADDTVVPVRVTVTNLRAEPLEFAYLCHINWALEGLSGLKQSVPKGSGSFTLAPHPGQTAATAELLEQYAADLESADVVDVNREIIPEYCAVLTPVPTETGQAEFLGVREDGAGLWVSYDLERLPKAVRWISNTSNEKAAGFCLPSTGHHFGRTRNQEDGLLQSLGPGESAQLNIAFGKLSKEDASAAAGRIDAVL